MGADLILGDIARENLFVLVMRASRRVVRAVSAVIAVGVMRVMGVFDHHPHCLQFAMPRRGAPRDGEQDGEVGAKTRHQKKRVSSNENAARRPFRTHDRNLTPTL